MMFDKWYQKLGAVVMALGISFAVVLMTKQDHTKYQKDPAHITFSFDHWLPKTIKMGAITLCQHVYYAQTQEQVNPYASSGAAQLVRHELEHVSQCENVGAVDFFIDYHVKSMVGFLKHWAVDAAYRDNMYEKMAYSKQTAVYDTWMMGVVAKYWQKGASNVSDDECEEADSGCLAQHLQKIKRSWEACGREGGNCTVEPFAAQVFGKAFAYSF